MRSNPVTLTRYVTLTALITLGCAARADDKIIYLSDCVAELQLRHSQQWGELGLNTAAAATGRPGSPMRIGTREFQKGLGHHANGEITLDLEGQYREFATWIGVQWQGGGKGKVVFRVELDGKSVFESKSVSDSQPAQELKISVVDAQQLKLIAEDGRNGIACDMANWAEARLVRRSDLPLIGIAKTTLDGIEAPAVSGDFCGLSIVGETGGPQIVLRRPQRSFSVDVLPDETAEVAVPIQHAQGSLHVSAQVQITRGSAHVEMKLGHQSVSRLVAAGEQIQLKVPPNSQPGDTGLHLITRGVRGETIVEWSQLKYQMNGRQIELPLRFPTARPVYPPATLPDLRPRVEQMIIEWDWRMQDGIETIRCPNSWSDAIASLRQRGDALISELQSEGRVPAELIVAWQQLNQRYESLIEQEPGDPTSWQSLWRQTHQLRRRIMLSNPLAQTGPIVFAKRVPSCFSHQLTQYYGMCARPGGGIFVLERPGESMQCTQLTALAPGSYQHPEVSWDGRRILFSYCQADSAPVNRAAHQDRHFHLYEMNSDGSGLRQLTDGDNDDFSPRYLPDGRLLFLSTRRGGFHRCGAGPCPVYTLATANADGSDPQPISYHETHEWDPAVLNDGRIVYTRWDYVDRHAVHYQHLWSCRPDGSNVAAYYGNNTLNPVGVWEARPIPGSNLLMATAGAHHAMTAGSIILIDIAGGIDGLDPITRLTPDAPFPESEAPVQRWHAKAGLTGPIQTPIQAQRWPGHCYRTPYPLSEKYFLAAYSFDPLIGEPSANKANMFGIYLVDRFGNKELLYRDLNIGSLWPTPLRPRTRPPALPSTPPDPGSDQGTFFVQNVYDSWPKLPAGPRNRIQRLRVVQVLPKTTPHINTPRVGLANASPGKQVLGTVPVEEDGSALFHAPARVALAFQALDQHGMAVQTMRSLTYLQPGEQTSCVGCHEHRESTPDLGKPALALGRPPSEIVPGPDGSRPLCYPILVQGVLDKHCVSCHGVEQPAGGVALTGDPQGAFSVSYNALAPMVPISQWKGTPVDNHEPMTFPNRFGARASKLTQLLIEGHQGVSLSADELERLVTWMDANALFYGTFKPEDQSRQLRGERIAGPALE